MDNDLISRDDLREQIENSIAEYGGTYSTDLLNGLGMTLQMINEAPAVDISKLILIISMRSGKREMMLNALRPQGEWLKVKDKFAYATYYHWDCPFCKAKFGKVSNFCPNCGARMLEGGAEE
jgi:hypothetical protein